MAVKKKALKRAKRRVKPKSRAKSITSKRTTKSRARKYVPTFIELKMWGLLRRMGVGAIAQYQVARRTRGRHYYLDFAIPHLMLAIECDGAAYHRTSAQLRYDRKRQRELEGLGWRVIRFTGSQIVTDIESCQKVLQPLLKRNESCLT